MSGGIQFFLTDFISAKDDDATTGFLLWLSAMKRSDSPEVYGIITSGEYSLSSVALMTSNVTINRSGVKIVGHGRPTLRVTGKSSPAAIIRATAGILIENITFVGNMSGTGYTNGSAIHIENPADAKKPLTGVSILSCRFDGFRSVYVLAVTNLSDLFGISDVNIMDNIFYSRAGSSIDPSSLGMNAANILINGNSRSNISDFGVKRNIGYCEYIKTHVQIQNNCEYGLLEENVSYGAGQLGAHDDKGGYAFVVYAGQSRTMTDIIVRRNRAIDSRSTGIYCPGLQRNLLIESNLIDGTTDTTFVAIRHGGINVTGGYSCTIRDNVVRNIAAIGIWFSAASTGTLGPYRIVNNSVHSRGEAFQAFHSGQVELTDFVMEGLIARGSFIHGVLIQNNGLKGWKNSSLSGLDIESSNPASYGVRLLLDGDATSGSITNIVIGDNKSRIKVGARGLDLGGSGTFSSRNSIGAIRFIGPMSFGAICADHAAIDVQPGVAFTNFTSGGYCFRTNGATGTIALNVKFIGVSADHISSQIGRDDLGISAPQRTRRGDIVKSLLPAVSGVLGWVGVDLNVARAIPLHSSGQ